MDAIMMQTLDRTKLTYLGCISGLLDFNQLLPLAVTPDKELENHLTLLLLYVLLAKYYQVRD